MKIKAPSGLRVPPKVSVTITFRTTEGELLDNITSAAGPSTASFQLTDIALDPTAGAYVIRDDKLVTFHRSLAAAVDKYLKSVTAANVNPFDRADAL